MSDCNDDGFVNCHRCTYDDLFVKEVIRTYRRIDAQQEIWDGTTPPKNDGSDGNLPPIIDASDGSESALEDFDFAVVRYRWEPSAGRDLDTRTFISTPNRKTNTVGFARRYSDYDYLIWNNDNLQSGVEAVLFSADNFIRDFPLDSNIAIDLCAYWYNTVYTGDLQVEFTTYKGGVMKKDANTFNFVNEGGATIQRLIINTNTMLEIPNGTTDGEHLATLTYNATSRTGTLVKVLKP